MQKQIGKIVFVAVIVGIILYTFRDSAGPIAEQLAKTTPMVIAGICGLTVVYHLTLLREQCRMLEASAKEILRKKSLVAGIVALSLLKSCMWYAIPYLVFRSQSDITVWQTMAVTSLSVMLAAVLLLRFY